MTGPGSAPAAGAPLLVIDNDEGLLELLSFVFTERGFSVTTARQGAEGLALAKARRPAVIICDIIMDDMHGFEVLR
ncbi:MAG TPA: response regulator, partial [Methylomirabilota bacterium]|nr:response regulator [Methylomirabilota bacterium]